MFETACTQFLIKMANPLFLIPAAFAISFLVVTISLALLFTQEPEADDLIVSLPKGKVRGSLYLTPNNISYYGFRGMPYAIPPVGELRFESPKPAMPWNHIWDATSDSKSCVSDNYLRSDDESEDCLYINVYTPNLKPQQNLTVMVYIFGGGFRNGKSTKTQYGPDYLVEEDIVLVSLNYRVGALSFLSTADEVLPGNLGLKDQALALKWVQQNIEYFGGDPRKVTIFGNSAGATSVGLQLISKLSTGLFRAAIVQSGSSTVDWAVDKDPKTFAYLMADRIPGGNYGNDTGALKKFLKERSVQEIVTSAADLLTLNVNISLPGGQLQAWPTIEVETENAFLTESPYKLLESGNFNKVPIMIGIVGEEALLFFDDLNHVQDTALLYDKERERNIPSDLYPNSTYQEEAIQVIRNTYLGNNTSLFVNSLIDFMNYYSDNMFVRGIIKHGELASAYVPVFMYEFSYYGGRANKKPFIEGAEKVTHGGELSYIFNQEGLNDRTHPADMLTQNRLVKLWTNFAKYLNPTPEKSSLFNNVIWTRFTKKSYPYLSINNTLEMRYNIKQSNYPIWNQVYDKYGRKPFITF